MRAHLRNTSASAARCGTWLFRHRSYVLLPLAGLLVFAAVFATPLASTSWTIGQRVLGLVFLAVGEAIRLRVAGGARSGTSGRGRHFRAESLITGGLYAWTRNPLYLGNLTIWAGMALLVSGVPTLVLLLTIVGLHHHLIISAEERFLLERHGEEYARYLQSVPRLLPRPRWRRAQPARQHAQAPASFSWRRALLREHDTLFLIVAGAWLLLTLKARLIRRDEVGVTAAWLSFGVLACLAWIVLKILKKMNHYRSDETSPHAGDVKPCNRIPAAHFAETAPNRSRSQP